LGHLSSICKDFQIEENVEFLGQVRHEEIPSLFQSADIFCLSSLREGNPNVVLEALSTGLPVAATPVGGVPELIKKNVNGLLSSDFSSENLAHAISSALDVKW
jgi:glycosyltransferase involved in cell wall biosynthesis